MIEYPWGALAVGLMMVTASILTLVRHFLLEPVSSHYPKAPLFVRHSMFLFASVVMFIGMQFVMLFFSDAPNTIPPQPSAQMQLLATSLLLYKAMMLGNIVRQRYPTSVWDKLNRINDTLRCGNKAGKREIVE